MTVAVLPASFDPITVGHVDIITRASNLFEHLIVAVYAHPKKNVMFSVDERVDMVKESLEGFKHVEVRAFEGLLVDFCREMGASVLVRGLRWVSDFESEFQQAAANRNLLPGTETLCLFASPDYVFFSSTIIKEIAENAGDVSSMVPGPVATRLMERFPPRMHVHNSREVTQSTF
ncbi:MAG: pantetheine-phosphate adenylyltransferase [Chloroflexota bacterium]